MILAPPVAPQCPRTGRITVVNMVPVDQSGEFDEDSEPSLAVDYSDPSHLVGTAFTPDPNNVSAPIYYSLDGGATWSLNCILPGENGTSGTNDVSVALGTTSGNLYIALLPAGSAGDELKVLRTDDFTVKPGNPIFELFGRVEADQPHVTSVVAWGPIAHDQDLVYITYKNIDEPEGKTSVLERSDTTPLVEADFQKLLLEELTNCGADGPTVISAPQLSGRVYAAFVRWNQGCAGSPTPSNVRPADLVVLRDDGWGIGSGAFLSLSHKIVVGSSTVYFRGLTAATFNDLTGQIGRQRIFSKVAIAASPTDEDLVYVAWGEVNSSGVYELHLMRSTNAGLTWSNAITPIPQALNPALAVNIHGVVGFLYQIMDGDPSNTNSRWKTCLMTLNKELGILATDTLISMPNTAPPIDGPGPLGDYLQLLAVGKNFYGVFSGMNYPNCDYFPQGVNYQRNIEWDGTVGKFLDFSGDPMASNKFSVDPFFFKLQSLPTQNDFYVRDWTKDVGDADPGLEPSSERNFYSTSDVWNRRSDQPGSFTNDQPSSELPGSGAGAAGDNWLFARIRRNEVPASGSQEVRVNFLVSKFGTGSNFVDVNDVMDPNVTFPASPPPVTFAATDPGPITTAAFRWHLDISYTSHLCMAVEIDTDLDPLVASSLRGKTPGWATGTDLRVIYDNNKAQRNTGAIYMSMESSSADASGEGDGASESSSYYAIVHNAATFTRDVVLKYEATSRVRNSFPHASIRVIGRNKAPLWPPRPVTLTKMQPGENRWIELHTGKPKLKQTPTTTPSEVQPIEFPVYFYEMVGEVPMNGFAIAVKPMPAATLYPENLRFHKATFARPVLQHFPAQREAAARSLSDTQYLGYLDVFLSDWRQSGERLLDSLKFRDPFHLQDASKDLGRAVTSRDAPAAATLHAAFLNRLDSYLTMVELSRGDLADILQNVSWQKAVFERTSPERGIACPDSIINASKRFIRDYSRRAIGQSGYVDHIRDVLPCLRQIAQDAPRHRKDLLDACDRMQLHRADPRALQGAHRDYLLALDRRPSAH